MGNVKHQGSGIVVAPGRSPDTAGSRMEVGCHGRTAMCGVWSGGVAVVGRANSSLELVDFLCFLRLVSRLTTIGYRTMFHANYHSTYFW